MAVVIENEDKLLQKLLELSKLDLTQGLERACLVVENDAKQKCPVNDGTLRNSITHKVEGDQGEVGSDLEYAPYVEYGTGIYSSKGNGRKTPWSYQDEEGNWWRTVGQHPKPYLIPALEENREKVAKEIMNEIRKGLE